MRARQGFPQASVNLQVTRRVSTCRHPTEKKTAAFNMADALLALLKLDAAICRLIWSLFLHLALRLSIVAFYCIFDFSVVLSTSTVVTMLFDFEHRSTTHGIVDVATLLVAAVASGAVANMLPEEDAIWHVRWSTLLGIVDAFINGHLS
ncbi:hypothetical protein CERZMDRAFT_97986 [Cercospora zeae-maydis SCOH1-5]|uniref:Uncharacterized protein n=1 Tax=Cercospora zeae-maydis SCOH1-5 TaxID=717836 RepID=A0A6A6FF97_9PEZI|nr:hypothetical protein CERZMDRAFT_97986 [Cercospora zeae-maydis SCOH1-5]